MTVQNPFAYCSNDQDSSNVDDEMPFSGIFSEDIGEESGLQSYSSQQKERR